MLYTTMYQVPYGRRVKHVSFDACIASNAFEFVGGIGQGSMSAEMLTLMPLLRKRRQKGNAAVLLKYRAFNA